MSQLTRAGYFRKNGLEFIPLKRPKGGELKQKNFVADRNQLVNLLVRTEGTKRQAHVNAARKIFKLMVEFDVQARLAGLRAPTTLLAKEAIAKVRAIQAKKVK